jgi:hypothetical protein
MGIGKFFKSFVSDEALGDETIKTTEKIYLRAQREQPHRNPHEWLESTWLNRAKAKGHKIDDPDMHKLAFTETLLHACIKPPLCSRSLGLYFLYKENPHIIEKHPRFAEEYNSLMDPVMQAKDEDRINNLYKRYNPNLAEELDDDEEDDDEVKMIVNVFEENCEDLVHLISKNVSPEMINNKMLLEIAVLTAFMLKNTFVYSKGVSENVLYLLNEAFSSMLEIIDNNCFDHLKHTSKDEKLKFLKKLTKFITIRTDQYKKAFVKDKSDVTRAYINLSKLFVKNFYSGSVKDIEKNEESFKLMMTMALELQYYFEDCIEQFS